MFQLLTEEQMDSDQLDKNTSQVSIVEGDSEKSVIDESNQWHSSSLVLRIKANHKFSIQDLVNIKPGTLFIADSPTGVGRTYVTELGQGWRDTSVIGYQWFHSSFVRGKEFHVNDLNQETPDEVMTKVLSYNVRIRANMVTYEMHHLGHLNVAKNKDEVIGLYLGHIIVGIRGAIDQVVLMKMMAEDSIGWLCFLKLPNETFLELQ